MSNPTIISVDNLGKCYRIRHLTERQNYVALRDVMADRWRKLFQARRRDSVDASGVEDFWALKGVSFEVKQGEVVGIIGRNGAGKSTLLKVLSRITEPSKGRVRIKGRVASLLEVGTGFHPELTGRENIYLNGAILGMSRAEIRKKFDEIVSFAEVEKFLDTPVKRYSSGMYVRLAFAVAAHLEPEILIVDEVLAVGDAEFQKKCLDKMKEVGRGGRTVLFVSHNMGAIRTLCSRAVMLHQGQIALVGDIGTVISSYLQDGMVHPNSRWIRTSEQSLSSPVYFKTAEAHLEGGQPALNLICHIQVECVSDSCPKAFIAIGIGEAIGTPLMQAVPVAHPFLEFKRGTYSLDIQVCLPPLIPGIYTIDLWLGSHYNSTIEHLRNIMTFTVEESPQPERSFPFSADHGYMVPVSKCHMSKVVTN